jgi:hypothetical protein
MCFVGKISNFKIACLVCLQKNWFTFFLTPFFGVFLNMKNELDGSASDPNTTNKQLIFI